MTETPPGFEAFAENTPNCGVPFVEIIALSDGKHVAVMSVLRSNEPAGELLLDCDDLAMRLASLRVANLLCHETERAIALGGERPSSGSRDINKKIIVPITNY